MAKITMQDIADALGISRVTVWKIFNNQEGVSDALRAQIISKADELGYLKSIPKSDTFKVTDRRTFSVIVSRPQSSVFWTTIIHRIAQELTKYEIDLIYTYVPSSCPDGYALPASLTDGTIDGCIILNVYDRNILFLVNELSIPKVFLDVVTDFPIQELTGDLVLLEGQDAVRILTNTVIKKGRTNIGFIGDINYAKTNADRYQGFRMAMEENHLEVNPRYCLTNHLGIYTYKDEVHKWLQALSSFPEAFICTSDYVAHFLQLYLQEHNIHVPEDIAVTGYDGTSEYSNVANILTTVNVELPRLGKRLAQQLLFRLNNQSLSKEVIYIISEIVYKDSTDF